MYENGDIMRCINCGAPYILDQIGYDAEFSYEPYEDMRDGKAVYEQIGISKIQYFHCNICNEPGLYRHMLDVQKDEWDKYKEYTGLDPLDADDYEQLVKEVGLK